MNPPRWPLRCHARLWNGRRCDNHHHRGRYHYTDHPRLGRDTWYSERILSRWWTVLGYALGAARRQQ